MHTSSRYGQAAFLAAALAIVLTACSGDTGPTGARGASGPSGPPGVDGVDGASGASGSPGGTGPVGPAGPSGPSGPTGATGPAGSSGRSTAPGLTVKVVSVTQAAAGAPVQVRFTLTDDFGFPIDVKGVYSQNAPFQPRFSLSQIATGTVGPIAAPVSVTLPYVVLSKSGSTAGATDAAGVTVAPTSFTPGSSSNPLAVAADDAQFKGVLVENAPGSGDYTYSFPTGGNKAATVSGAAGWTVTNPVGLGDPATTHTLWIQASRQTDLFDTSNTKTFFAQDKEHNFRPDGSAATLKREVVTTANCSNCHRKFKPETSVGGAFHGGARVEGPYCNVCHNPDRITNPVADSAVFVHRIHQSEHLQTQTTGTNSGGTQVDPAASGGFRTCSLTQPCTCTVALPCSNMFHDIEATYPQDIRHCDTCHGANPNPDTGATLAAPAQGSQAYSNPTRKACGSCHDYVNFGETSVGALCRTGLGGGVVRNAATGIPVPCDHVIGPQTDDLSCAGCHSAAAIKNTYHLSVSPPAKDASVIGGTNSNTNAAWVAAANVVPPGASKFTYLVSSVTLVDDAVDATIKHPAVTFKIQKDGVDVNFGTFDAVNNPSMFGANFRGAPSAYFVWALPQDGLAAPADFNASASCYLLNAWKGTGTTAQQKTSGVATSGYQGASTCTAATPCLCSAGTPCHTTSECSITSAPDAGGNYTVVMTYAQVPTGAVMLTGGIGFTYALSGAPPITQIAGFPAPVKYPYVAPGAAGTIDGVAVTVPANAAIGYGGLIVPATDAYKVATGFTGRRPVVSSAKCNACHVSIGVAPTFHAGQRNDGPSCSWCHNPNRTSSAWSANAKDFVHSLHAGRVRTDPFTWHASAVGEDFSGVGFPAALDTCQACHDTATVGTAKFQTYDFSSPTTQAAFPSMLPSTVGQGRYNALDRATTAGYSISDYVDAANTTDYGFGFAVAPVTYTLPDGVSGTQGATACTPSAPCVCTAANRCSVTVDGPLTIQGVSVTFTQRVDTTTAAVTTCSAATPCTCQTNPASGTTTACTAVVANCTQTAPCDAQGSTLVKSPITAACSACHDAPAARAHMETNGGSFYRSRFVAGARIEQCLICHGPNSGDEAIGKVHK